MSIRHKHPLLALLCREWGGWSVSVALLAAGLAEGASALPDPGDHWSFKPLQRPAVPPGRGTNAIDRFMAASPTRHGAGLAAEAGRRTLIRRLSFDLRGLPPTPEEVAAFVQDPRPDAYLRLVDSFLDSPHYGERWGRHWLDIVAYADSNGYFNADSDRPLAWKYRDYVVRSIQGDKPFDRFIQEQVAGDEMAGYVAGGDLTPEKVDLLIATHFWRNVPDGTGESDGNPLEVKVDKYAVLEGNVQLVGSAFLGLTLQCAKCHDHKFEPVGQEDYYGIQAILRPVFDPDHWLKPNERGLEVGTVAERQEHKRRTDEANRNLKTLREGLEGLMAPFRKQLLEERLSRLEEPVRKEVRTAVETREKDRTEGMKALLKTHAAVVEIPEEALLGRFPTLAHAAELLKTGIKSEEAARPAPLERISAAFESTNPPPAHHLLIRGNHATEGKETPPRVPEVLARTVAFHPGERSSGSPPTTGRRLGLARWLTDRENPMVLRVLVNRVWKYHFGTGLTATVDNAGRGGGRPSDPGLLDWLAVEFRDSGWSLKQLHRLMVTSASYRQVSGAPLESPRRLDAESIRDAMLAVSGELDPAVGGAYVPTKPDADGQIVIDEKQPGAHRRSLYLQQRRTLPVGFLAAFDGPAHNPVCVQRINSTVALQSLSLLNAEFTRERAKAFARRVLGGSGTAQEPAIAPQLHTAFELAYGRPPTDPELDASRSFLKTQSQAYAGKPDSLERAWTDLCQMLLASNPFLYVD